MMTGLVGFLEGYIQEQTRKTFEYDGRHFFPGASSDRYSRVFRWMALHAMMEFGLAGDAGGKKALNLRVTDMTGARVTFNRASGRHFGKIITGLIPVWRRLYVGRPDGTQASAATTCWQVVWSCETAKQTLVFPSQTKMENLAIGAELRVCV